MTILTYVGAQYTTSCSIAPKTVRPLASSISMRTLSPNFRNGIKATGLNASIARLRRRGEDLEDRKVGVIDQNRANLRELPRILPGHSLAEACLEHEGERVRDLHRFELRPTGRAPGSTSVSKLLPNPNIVPRVVALNYGCET
jgi:hypothetical protein